MLRMKAGDRLPLAPFTIDRRDHALGFEAQDVAEVRFIARRVDDKAAAPQIDRVLDPSWYTVGTHSITGHYHWQDGDTVAGEYVVEIRVRLHDGREVTFPNHQHGRLHVLPRV